MVLGGDPGTGATDKAVYDALVGEAGVYYNIQDGKLQTATVPALKGTTNDPKTYTADNNEYGYVSGTDYANHAINVKYNSTTDKFTWTLN